MIRKAIFLICLCGLVESGNAQAPMALSYQGKLTNTGGAPVTGSVDVVVNVFTNQIDGLAVYSENIGSVPVEDGIYSFSWGANGAPGLIGVLREGAAETWMEVTIDGAPLSPRQRLLAVPYAIRSANVDIIDADTIYAEGVAGPYTRVSREGDTMTGALTNTVGFVGNGAGLTDIGTNAMSAAAHTAFTVGAGSPTSNWRVWNDHTKYYAFGGEGDGVYVATNDFSGLMQYIIDYEGIAGGYSYSINLAANYHTNGVSYPYLATATVRISAAVVIRGEGNSSTRIHGAASLNGPAFTIGPAVGNPVGGITAFHSIRFEGADAGSNASAILFENAHEPNVWDCVFNGWKKAGVYFSQQNFSDWSSISRCWFIVNNGGAGILSDQFPSRSGPYAQSLIVEGSYFGIGNGVGIEFTQPFYNVQIRGNRFLWYSPYSTSARGISLDGVNGSQIVNNTFDDWPPNTIPIRLEDQASSTNLNILVANNTAVRNSVSGLDSTPYVVYVGTNVTGTTLIGNNSEDGVGYLLSATNSPVFILDETASVLPGSLTVGSILGTLELSGGTTTTETGGLGLRETNGSGVIQSGGTVYLDFDDNNNDANSTLAMRYNGGTVAAVFGQGSTYLAGNVGVGTNTPASRLHVNGDLTVTGDVTADAFVGSGAGLKTYTAVYSEARTLTSSECYGSVIYVDGANQIDLPAVAEGMSVRIVSTTAAVVSVSPNGAETFRLDGPALAAGHEVHSPGAAGDAAVFTYFGPGVWYVTSNAWVDGGAS